MAKECISEFPALPTDLLDEIERLVQPLKAERDLWKARAEAYKTAFESQTARLQEAVEVCLLTRAELDNMRARRQCSQPMSITETKPTHGTHSTKSQSSHTLISEGEQRTSKVDREWQSTPVSKATFGTVEELLSHDDVSKAREEIDRILPGRLSHEARVEGLLLKSAICRASGPDWALEGLAQCSEAMTLCEKISNLSSLLPKIHYHRGLCLLRLRQLEQARDAFAAIQPSHPLHERSSKYRRSCDDELEGFGSAKRRSAFDEHRTITENFLSSWKDGEGVCGLSCIRLDIV